MKNPVNNFESSYGLRQKILNDFLKNIIGEKSVEHKEIIARLSSFLIVERDVECFAKLCNDIFVNGYAKATMQYKEKVEEKGYKFTIVNLQSSES
jgi:hypothetical protein